LNYGKVSGALLFVGSAQFIIALTAAEALYPSYSVSQNYISDLGATCRVSCQIMEPSAIIFNSSVLLLGVFGVLTVVCMLRGLRDRILPLFLGLSSVGSIGVGLFPETTGSVHTIVSLITFVFAGLAAIVSYRVQRTPISYFSILLGVTTLVPLHSSSLTFFSAWVRAGWNG